MAAAETNIDWPEDLRPEVAGFHAVNEIQVDAPRERVFDWLRQPSLWPVYYGNSMLVKHHEGPWPRAEVGTRFRWVTFGLVVQSEIVVCDEPAGRFAWSAKELGAKGHHEWILTDRDGGTHVLTEETQRGVTITPIAPVMRRLMERYHQKWLEGLARVAAEGPPPEVA